MIPKSITKLFEGCDIEFASVNENLDCDFCGGNRGDSVEFNISGKENCRISVCRKCADEWLGKERLDREITVKTSDAFTRSVASLTEEMSRTPDRDEFFAEYPEFRNAFNEFQSGNYTLDDGEQDELLQSIARQFDRRGSLSEKQVRAFAGRCSYYCEEKMKGNPLSTPEAKHRGKEVVDPLFEKADGIGRQFFGEDEEKKITSLKKWYGKRGYLTVRQVELLVKTIKKAESRV